MLNVHVKCFIWEAPELDYSVVLLITPASIDLNAMRCPVWIRSRTERNLVADKASQEWWSGATPTTDSRWNTRYSSCCFIKRREKSSWPLISLRCWIIHSRRILNQIIDIFSEDVFSGFEFYSKTTSGVEVRRYRIKHKLAKQKFFFDFLLESYQRWLHSQKLFWKLPCSRVYYWPSQWW